MNTGIPQTFSDGLEEQHLQTPPVYAELRDLVTGEKASRFANDGIAILIIVVQLPCLNSGALQ